jgi:hypothetical protein
MQLVREHWSMHHNWRETPDLTGGDNVVAKAWIAPGKDDVRLDQIALLTRDPDHADYLRPAAVSPLATKGAGGDLPSYIGAVAPQGTKPWDWHVTWAARHSRPSAGASKHE